MTVFVDDQLVYKIDERITDAGVNRARHIPVGELAPGTHTIGFRLDPFTGVQSVARISNIKLGEVVKKTVEPQPIDFETPALEEGEVRRIIDPYVDEATGVTFTAEPGNVGDEVVGLVRNFATSACVEPADGNQKLGTGRQEFEDGSIGQSGFAIRAAFSERLSPPVRVSVEFQTRAGKPVRLRLFGIEGEEVASVTDVALPADGTCNLPGEPRARKTLTATATQPVAFAIMDLESATGGFVFVTDNFEVFTD